MTGHLCSDRGWRAVAGCFLVLTLGFAAAYSCPAFAEAIAAEFGVSRGGAGMVLAIATGVAFLVSAIGGPLADRCGARPVAMAGMGLVGLGLALASAAMSFGQVLLCYGGLVGVGLGFAYVPAVAAVQRWFTRRRGLASGLAVSGIGLGTALVPAAAALPARLGGDWRDALLLCSVLVALGGVGGAALLGEPPPAPIGDGAAPAPEGPGLRDVLRSRDFALLYLGTLLVSAPLALPFAHLAPSARDAGVPGGDALALIGLVGVASLPGRVVLGALADRLGRRAVFLFCCGGVAAATGFWAAAADRLAFGLFAGAFGVLYGGFVALLPAFTADAFGRGSAGGVIGVLYTGRGLSVLAATPAVAVGAVACGGYAPPLAAAAGLGFLGTCVLAAVGAESRFGVVGFRHRSAAWPDGGCARLSPARYRAAIDTVWWTKP